MPIVAVRNLMEGMILSGAVVVSGREILSEGAQVDGRALALLADAGVARVGVTEESYGLAALIAAAGPGWAEEEGAWEPAVPPDPEAAAEVRAALMRIAGMFGGYREDRLMRELCRLAIKCARERLISV